MAVDAGRAGLYGARGRHQRVEQGFSPAGYDADLDEVYGGAQAGGLRVQDHEISPRQEGARPPDGVLAAAYPRGSSPRSCSARASHPPPIFARCEGQGHPGVTPKRDAKAASSKGPDDRSWRGP